MRLTTIEPSGQQCATASIGSPFAPKAGMRILVGFLILACVVGFVLSRRSHEKPVAPTQTVNASPDQTDSPREPSQHNWPKRALDRAADVKRQVADQQKSNEEPLP